jgi:hypothetical protein
MRDAEVEHKKSSLLNHFDSELKDFKAVANSKGEFKLVKKRSVLNFMDPAPFTTQSQKKPKNKPCVPPEIAAYTQQTKHSLDEVFREYTIQRLKIDQMDQNLTRTKSNFAYCVSSDDFNKKEVSFGKQLVSLKNQENCDSLNQQIVQDTYLSDIILQDHVIAKANAIRSQSLKIVETQERVKSLNSKAVHVAKKNFKENVYKPMEKHKEIFKLENVMVHKRKLEKDPDYADQCENQSSYTQKRLREQPAEYLLKRTKMVRLAVTADDQRHHGEPERAEQTSGEGRV